MLVAPPSRNDNRHVLPLSPQPTLSPASAPAEVVLHACVCALRPACAAAPCALRALLCTAGSSVTAPAPKTLNPKPCCCAGSNVAALQTEAVLDVLTDEWVIHTPDEGAIKWWIGNAAEDGRACTVFARCASLPPLPPGLTGPVQHTGRPARRDAHR